MSLRFKSLLDEGVKKGIYPGAVLLVAVSGSIIELCSAGYSQLIPYPIRVKKDTLFDLASLTKPIATTLCMMKLINDKILSLDTPINEIFSFPLPQDKKKITPRMLLSHCSGLPAWKPYYLKLARFPMKLRKKIIREWILKEELLYKPGKDNLYSDLGFMMLEWIIEYVTGIQMRDFLMRLYSNFKVNSFLGYPRQKLRRDDFAATEFCPWRKRIIQGEVHDENAFCMDGFSGHAGLFGTAMEVFIISDMLLAHYCGRRKDIFKKDLVQEFFSKHNKRWALGWDTPTGDCPSAGSYFSKFTVGHLGFTGTSIWMDLKKEIIIIFLTNRIHPTRKNTRIKEFRPYLHNRIMKEIS